MKKVYKLQDLDCANCAAKIEDAIGKIAGVEKASVSFLSQKMTIEAQDFDHERILEEAKKITKKLEPEVVVLTK